MMIEAVYMARADRPAGSAPYLPITGKPEYKVIRQKNVVCACALLLWTTAGKKYADLKFEQPGQERGQNGQVGPYDVIPILASDMRFAFRHLLELFGIASRIFGNDPVNRTVNIGNAEAQVRKYRPWEYFNLKQILACRVSFKAPLFPQAKPQEQCVQLLGLSITKNTFNKPLIKHQNKKPHLRSYRHYCSWNLG